MSEAEIRAMFTLAGIDIQRVWKLPNGYVGELEPLTDNEVVRDVSNNERGYRETRFDKEDHGPTLNVVRSWMDDYRWRLERPSWLVKTEHGLIEIGWRKRVIQIEWSETPARLLVTQDDVTKHNSLVHAWSVAKAIEYLAVLAVALKTPETANR